MKKQKEENTKTERMEKKEKKGNFVVASHHLGLFGWKKQSKQNEDGTKNSSSPTVSNPKPISSVPFVLPPFSPIHSPADDEILRQNELELAILPTGVMKLEVSYELLVIKCT